MTPARDPGSPFASTSGRILGFRREDNGMRRLGDLERSVMEALWASPEPLTARGIQSSLPGRSALTTVLTVLERLERKGFVDRDRAERAHSYRAARSKEEYVSALMMEALGETNDRATALVRFVESVGDADAKTLRDALPPRRRR